jgi:hypothetical protein
MCAAAHELTHDNLFWKNIRAEFTAAAVHSRLFLHAALALQSKRVAHG